MASKRKRDWLGHALTFMIGFTVGTYVTFVRVERMLNEAQQVVDEVVSKIDSLGSVFRT